MKLVINNDTFRYLNAFSTLTGVTALDCFEYNREIVYVVEPGKISLAIGKKGSNIRKVEDLLKKKIKLVEYSKDPITFVRNALFPYKVKNILIATKSDGSKSIKLMLDSKTKKAMGRDMKKVLNFVRTLLKRHYPNYELEVIEA